MEPANRSDQGDPPTAPRPPLPPFDGEAAVTKVRLAENAWNTRDPAAVALAYSIESRWRNRDVFLQGRPEIISFLTDKWQRERDYRLVKELWAFTGDRIAVRFAYEWHDENGNWFRSHGNENWQFDGYGLMTHRHASINDQRIDDTARLFRWDRSGPRPPAHPGLSELGL